MAPRNFVFTQHVRDLVRGDVTRQELESPWRKLRDALTAEMRQRGLFGTSPACVGLYGFANWSEEALDELASDCYSAVFLRRLPSLAAQLERKANVEGLVFNNIRYYLHEIQRKHDPIGFRVYTALRAAVCAAVDRGTLRIAEGDPAVRNNTVLALVSPHAAPTPPQPTNADAELERAARHWSEELLPDLVTARGTALDPLIAQLADRVARLANRGIETFRFQHLAKLLKDRVRTQWSALWAGTPASPKTDRELEDLARGLPQAARFEERQAFEQLVACVGETLEAEPVAPRTRTYLHRLWVFLWSHTARDAGALPSQRQLAEQLDIPRARFKELYATIGRAVGICQEAAARPQHAPHPAAEAPPTAAPERRQKVRVAL